jgi:hypothetical protein
MRRAAPIALAAALAMPVLAFDPHILLLSWPGERWGNET